MRRRPLLSGCEFCRLRLKQRHIEGPEVEGVEDSVAVPVRPELGRQPGVLGAPLGQGVQFLRGCPAVPGLGQGRLRLKQQTVSVEPREFDLDLGLLDGPAGGAAVEQVEIQGQLGAVVGHKGLDVAVFVWVEHELRRQVGHRARLPGRVAPIGGQAQHRRQTRLGLPHPDFGQLHGQHRVGHARVFAGKSDLGHGQVAGGLWGQHRRCQGPRLVVSRSEQQVEVSAGRTAGDALTKPSGAVVQQSVLELEPVKRSGGAQRQRGVQPGQPFLGQIHGSLKHLEALLLHKHVVVGGQHGLHRGLHHQFHVSLRLLREEPQTVLVGEHRHAVEECPLHLKAWGHRLRLGGDGQEGGRVFGLVGDVGARPGCECQPGQRAGRPPGVSDFRELVLAPGQLNPVVLLEGHGHGLLAGQVCLGVCVRAQAPCHESQGHQRQGFGGESVFLTHGGLCRFPGEPIALFDPHP